MSSGRLFHSFGEQKQMIVRRDKTWWLDSKLVGSWRPKSSPRWHVSNAAQCDR